MSLRLINNIIHMLTWDDNELNQHKYFLMSMRMMELIKQLCTNRYPHLLFWHGAPLYFRFLYLYQWLHYVIVSIPYLFYIGRGVVDILLNVGELLDSNQQFRFDLQIQMLLKMRYVKKMMRSSNKCRVCKILFIFGG